MNYLFSNYLAAIGTLMNHVRHSTECTEYFPILCELDVIMFLLRNYVISIFFFAAIVHRLSRLHSRNMVGQRRGNKPSQKDETSLPSSLPSTKKRTPSPSEGSLSDTLASCLPSSAHMCVESSIIGKLTCNLRQASGVFRQTIASSSYSSMKV